MINQQNITKHVLGKSIVMIIFNIFRRENISSYVLFPNLSEYEQIWHRYLSNIGRKKNYSLYDSSYFHDKDMLPNKIKM